ncbi:Fpg/Nei family DNA glycosylase [Anaerobacillus alkaliphilus]|uniref:Formamidopyrimidine-DNA glycosylase n=1 Tax=Anaerobacillus alkaliphilus TaxID=1548597 RepID=A0A4Q0W030_9BACI|nr:DNA-formamidopyrimidine glycosylase family protein [Anaerobacillus alkaliphilus]RXJ04161.1 Fpg/Nei family DNA glycosylase [Anaerobacillus alkaliphilus]
MPELPEMETYKQFLNMKMKGKPITNIVINREKSINVPVALYTNEVTNTTVLEIQRRAKHLIFRLSSGKNLVLHLMLGGWMFFGNEDDSPDRTKQIILSTPTGDLYFIGLRLGYLHLLDDKQLHEEFAKLGPEPLDAELSQEAFLDLVKNRRGMLKTTLVNQSFIAGIGNCYSDEICFVAKIKPTRKLNELTEQEKTNLYIGMKKALLRGIEQGGYMDDPFFKGDTLTGSYQTLVYDREGKPCLQCGTNIVLEIISSKKTFYCPNCQH